MYVALYQPEIPPNTGNIGRLCVGMGAALQIIGPCAFDFSDHALRRAGLDYWPNLVWKLHPDPDHFLEWLGDRQPWLLTKGGLWRFDEPEYGPEDVLIMGNELRGLPEPWLARWSERTVRIPINGPIRSYNLANATAVVLAHAKLKTGGFGAAGGEGG